jgi:predicted AlkP superfamily pyrophosphatase or phosphodiesterase
MIHSRLSRRVITLFLAAAILFVAPGSSATIGQDRKARPAKTAATNSARPRLVLLIVADQFRYDYLERFGDLFGQNGLRRMLREGASWIDCNYDHSLTYTAPSHATMMTGAYPALTGIIANDWPDRETGKKVSSVSDARAKLLGGAQTEEGASPRRLMASTLGDEMRLATNDRAKVIGISVKDRSAILSAGRHANAAYWLSMKTGMLVSSDYYFKQLPAWVASFDEAHPADKFFGAKWERLLPETEYLKRAGPDAPAWETVKEAGDTNTFPHVITGGETAPDETFYDALGYAPFTSDILLSFAEQAITNEQLGQDEDTDVLTVSFSANDYVGHRYGPYSQEVMDVTLRFDRQLGELLDFVDARVGLRNTLVVFTADHGVAPIPEHALAIGLSGGRVKSADIMAAVRAAISAHYNPQNKLPDATADYIYKYDDGGTMKDGFINGNLYFDRAALKRDGVRLEDIEQLACDAATTVRGISRCFTRAQIEAGGVSDRDLIGRRVAHGFYPSRSGDIIMVAEPFKYLASSETATHGTPYTYDTHVPLIIMGPGIEPGRYLQPSTTADIAPTLASLLRIQTPSNSIGRILIEALGH